MSYCRFWWDDSDVYVFDHVDGYVNCCGCRLEGDFRAETHAEMIDHLLEHRAAGHNVPEHALESLREVAGLPPLHPGRDFMVDQIEWMEKQADRPHLQEFAKMMRAEREVDDGA